MVSPKRGENPTAEVHITHTISSQNMRLISKLLLWLKKSRFYWFVNYIWACQTLSSIWSINVLRLGDNVIGLIRKFTGQSNETDIRQKLTVQLTTLYYLSGYTNTQEKNGKEMRRPGIEPGSTAWKAAMLTIIPPTLRWNPFSRQLLSCQSSIRWTLHYFLNNIASASIAQWQSVGLVNQRSWVQSSLEAVFFELKSRGKIGKSFDPDVIRTRSLLIWSQTRYRCATESTGARSYRDLNSDRWIQSPEC